MTLPNLIKMIVFVLLGTFISVAHSYYPGPYDEELDNMLLFEPDKAFLEAKERLHKAEMQGHIDNQLVALYYISEALFIVSRYDDLEPYVAKGLKLAEKSNNIIFQSEFLSFQVSLDELRGNYQQASSKANKALQLSQETSNQKLIAQQTSLRGQIHLAMENFDLAIQDVEKAIEVYKNNNDRKSLSLGYNLLALVYTALGDNDNAIKYYLESVKYDDIKAPYNQATMFYNLGGAYSLTKQFDLAVEYYTKSVELANQIKDESTLAFAEYGLAELYSMQKEHQKAEQTLLPSIEVFNKVNDVLMQFNSNVLMAKIKTDLKDFEAAKHYLDIAKQRAEVINTPNTYLYHILYNIDFLTAQEKWKEAFDQLKQSLKIQREVEKLEKDKLISELKVKFNAQFDQEKLELLEKQNELQQTTIQQELTKQKYLWGMIILGLVLFLIILYSYINQLKVKKYLYKLSVTDHLTQVANRRHVMEKLQELQKNSLENSNTFAVILIDLDFFKMINDNYGHDIGNDVLIHFANTAKRIVGDNGMVGRIGGEEWLILLYNSTKNSVDDFLYELRQTYQTRIPKDIPKNIVLSFSSGVILCNGQYSEYEQMLREVDAAMYKAKQKGREQDIFVQPQQIV